MLVLQAVGQPGLNRAWLWAHDEHEIDHPGQVLLEQLARRRQRGEPLAYVLQKKDFHHISLMIDERVLVPRADTETLVEWALSMEAGVDQPWRVLDLGTGSGAIALALAQQRPNWCLTGSDASPAALELASLNGANLSLAVRWVLGDWWQPLADQCFDLVLSNPPYIAADDPHLADLQHEPRMALVGGADGLLALRAIVSQASGHLNDAGWLLLEHGHEQAQAVREMLHAAGFEGVVSQRDLNGIERCSGGQWPGNL